MTENPMADTPQEGEITFAPNPDGGDENIQTSPTKPNDGDDTPTPEGDNNQEDIDDDKAGDDKTPFHEHPRWKQREEEWNDRFNDQETRHQDDIRKLREEFGQQKKDNAENTEIPSWFGGDQDQWNAYRADIDKQIKAAEERAIERVTEANKKESKAIEEATNYMKSEISAIEADKKLNPSGEKIDPNKLLKIVMDNDLIDSKGRWNYKAGYKLMQQTSKPVKPNTDRKTIASATTSESKGEEKPKAFKTSKDFQVNKPW